MANAIKNFHFDYVTTSLNAPYFPLKKRFLEFCLTCRRPPPFSQRRSQMYRKRQGMIRLYIVDGPSINQNEN